MNRIARVLGFCFLTVPALVAAVERPLVSDRPTQTFSALTVPAGRVQNELGYSHDQTGDVTLDKVGEWYFRWGVVRDFEIFVEIGSLAWEETAGAGTVHGWTDGGLGLRWTSQHGEGARPTAALLASTTLPTGGADFSEDTLQPEVIIAMEWGLGGGVALSSNVAWAWASEDLERFDRWWGSLVLDVNLGRGFGLFTEGFGYLSERPDGPSTGYLNAGVSYLVSSRVLLDARVELGRNGLDDDWLVGVGASWRSAGP